MSKFITDTAESIAWKVAARAGRKVEAIKALRAETGLGLYEAKCVVEEYDARLAAGQIAVDGVTTQKVNLPNGIVLNIVTRDGYSAIIMTKTLEKDIRPAHLAQAIADAALRATDFN